MAHILKHIFKQLTDSSRPHEEMRGKESSLEAQRSNPRIARRDSATEASQRKRSRVEQSPEDYTGKEVKGGVRGGQLWQRSSKGRDSEDTSEAILPWQMHKLQKPKMFLPWEVWQLTRSRCSRGGEEAEWKKQQCMSGREQGEESSWLACL